MLQFIIGLCTGWFLMTLLYWLKIAYADQETYRVTFKKISGVSPEYHVVIVDAATQIEAVTKAKKQVSDAYSFMEVNKLEG